MSKRKQLEQFNPDFVWKTMDNWVKSSLYYQQEAENSYKKLRSYLTMYQFRLTDQQKQEIREKLSSQLDKIDNNDQIDDMDSYLDGFCFQLDTSFIPTTSNTQSITSEQPSPPQMKQEIPSPVTSDIDMQSLISENATDHNDLDYYTLQFFH